MKELEKIVIGVVIYVFTILFLLWLATYAFGCAPVDQEVASQTTVEEDLGPLTITPHPTAGFKVVIVPKGTRINGWITPTPGLYLDIEAANSMAMQLIEAKKMREELEMWRRQGVSE